MDAAATGLRTLDPSDMPTAAQIKASTDSHTVARELKAWRPKCEFVGCHNVAIRKLTLKHGKRQSLRVCGPHSPKWSYDGTGSPFYNVSIRL